MQVSKTEEAQTSFHPVLAKGRFKRQKMIEI